jgi:hypothetical protein
LGAGDSLASCFGRVIGRTWDENTNEFGTVEARADVFVFAVQTCKDPGAYDALDLGQWEFYVVPAEHVRDSGQKGVGIAWVRRYAQPVAFAELSRAIEAAATPRGRRAGGRRPHRPRRLRRYVRLGLSSSCQKRADADEAQERVAISGGPAAVAGWGPPARPTLMNRANTRS